MKTILAAVAALSLAGAARAEVVDQSPQGFQSRHVVTIAAPPEKVRVATLAPSGWWNSSHSWSGDARNLTIDLVTGCFCEKLKDGFARHMTLVYAGDGALRLSGALGPLQFTGASGHMAFNFKAGADPATTVLTVTYDVGGYAKGGLAEQWAKPVDGVIGEQVARLKTLIETGKPG
ncbi:ATPase [Phenylobacterium sp.]|uniref:ATPase n=1 Tax=Phenylobacterium sp. TaxID=1871053 RepID=UPI002737DE59|nr:ATPase [Phenylobacterium sp.]MDP3866953.1 ATPase [Phenylobacterium sp.]